jgi:hypothetical protein
MDDIRILAGMAGVTAVTLVLLLNQLSLNSAALFGA